MGRRLKLLRSLPFSFHFSPKPSPPPHVNALAGEGASRDVGCRGVGRLSKAVSGRLQREETAERRALNKRKRARGIVGAGERGEGGSWGERGIDCEWRQSV